MTAGRPEKPGYGQPGNRAGADGFDFGRRPAATSRHEISGCNEDR